MSRRRRRRLPTPAAAVLMLGLVSPLLAAGAGGCAQRRLTITSEPSGALVYLNGQEVGRTPMRYDFKWYGDYDVVLRREGYETLKTSRKLNAPLHAVPPIDLLGEMVGARDVREWNFVMTPVAPGAADPAGLFARSAELQGELRSSKYTRLPATAPAEGSATRPTTRPASGQD